LGEEHPVAKKVAKKVPMIMNGRIFSMATFVLKAVNCVTVTNEATLKGHFLNPP
jgi:hypothetical protein